MTEYPPCPRCGTDAPYVCARVMRNGARRLDCRNPACRYSYNTLTGTIWHATKLTPAARDRLEALWRSGKNAHQIAKELGRDYRWVWVRVRQMETGRA